MSASGAASPAATITLGLERIAALLLHLGGPSAAYPIVQVAGTNGKGSVTALLAAILHNAGFSTGRFNSPHLVTPTDAIRINNAVVDPARYAAAYARAEAANTANDCHCSAFELQTAAAFLLFREASVDVAVVEVGVGGRLDATTASAPPAVCVVTAIGMDHVDLLGGSLEAIAAEKAGILRPGVKAAVFGPQDHDAAMAVLCEHAERLGIPAVKARPVRKVAPCSGNKSAPESALREIAFRYKGAEHIAKLALLGDFQLQNVGTALSVIPLLETLLGLPEIPLDAVKAALATVRWPGRLEWVDIPPQPLAAATTTAYRPRRILVDGAHNEPAAIALANFVHPHRGTNPVTWILAFTKGKDLAAILAHLVRPGDTIYATTFTPPDNMPWISCVAPAGIAAAARECGGTDGSSVSCIEVPSGGVGQCFELINGRAAPEAENFIVLCGSLYLVADLYRVFRLPI
ncbi:folylpolyglutamate synthase [Geranomyces variabilis]|uniref:Dihydrofolate synthetase n=1 Tax=Geranomyces variabilis TaxID=109894 RepID=A0AAD5TMR5_9FUNG|nr:folylpolyglutamate synthase [Geranomyces variabilis]